MERWMERERETHIDRYREKSIDKWVQYIDHH